MYLDSDTLVHSDIVPLYDSELNGRCIGAVRDIGTLWRQSSIVDESASASRSALVGPECAARIPQFLRQAR